MWTNTKASSRKVIICILLYQTYLVIIVAFEVARIHFLYVYFARYYLKISQAMKF